MEAPEKEESVYLKQYNEVLIHKLEKQMKQLKQTNYELTKDIAARKQAEEKIQQLNEELEQKVAERTADLKKAVTRLEELNRVFVGRELKMAELKQNGLHNWKKSYSRCKKMIIAGSLTVSVVTK